MDTYQLNLSGLLGLCGALFLAQRYTASSHDKKKPKDTPAPPKRSATEKAVDNAADASQWPFFTVFALVMGSDWLQGPFLYSLYREEHALSPATVSTLFTTGFITGGLSASLTGTLADRHGRKRACLAFCALSALACALTTQPALPLLALGRLLGGVSTSLLFSVFESWMVTDFHARHLAARGGADLSRTFGAMSTLNSGCAIASGVFSEWVVAAAGTRKAPFVVAVGLLAVAAWVIATRWEENYGAAAAVAAGGKVAVEEEEEEEKKKKKKEEEGASGDADADAGADMAPPKLKVWSLLKDPRIVCLGLASTMFEGSMYLFVFFWGPALASARGPQSGADGRLLPLLPLPYGTIFAAFMASVLAASLVFSMAMDRKLLRYVYLLAGLLAVADLVFYLLEQPRGEQATFWLFCLFEACVGVYWPCMGYLKGELIEDGLRAQLYSLLRVPLNVFVVVALYFTGDEDSFATVFATCSRLLLVAIGGVYAMIMNEDALP